MAEGIWCVIRRGCMALALGVSIASWAPVCAGSGEPGEEKTRLAFGLLSDVQYCDCETAGSRHYRASKDKLAACVDDLNRQDLAFTIHLGDFIQEDIASFETLLPVYQRLSMPRFHVLGNHDFDVDADQKRSIPARLGMADRHYEFRHPGTRFIVLDGGDVSLYARPQGSLEHARAEAMLEKLKTAGAPNAEVWNGAVGTAQLGWLARALADAKEAGERAIVFCHFPVYPPGAHNLWNDTEVVETLERSESVVAYISGHKHAGEYAAKNGIHYLTVKGMVETEDTTAYAVVHADDARLEVDGRGRQPDQVLVHGAPDAPLEVDVNGVDE